MSGAPFSPAWWLPGGHLQSLWGKLVRKQSMQQTRVQRLDTPDGDFLDIHHMDASAEAPRLILLHGLEGTIRSHYIQALLAEARRRSWGASVLIFRSCGTEPNQTRRFYHSGETTDLGLALDRVVADFPESPLLLAGVSLGGNVLLKFLGEMGDSLPPCVRAAVAVSVPFDLEQSSRHIDRGFSKVYQRYFIRSLRRKTTVKLDVFPDLVQRDTLLSIRTMHDFDNSLTAPLHGFRNAGDYYARSSSLPFLERIRITTLLLSAVDDPFLPAQVLDQVRAVAARNRSLHVEFPAGGGHVGFIGGGNPWRPAYYMEQRVGEFLAKQLAVTSPTT